MKTARTCGAIALAIAAAACGQGNSDNVMSPEANALEPAEVNAALGPVDVNATDLNMTANDMNTVVTNSPAVTESASNNAAE